MKMSIDHQEPRINAPVWDFLAEYPLNDLLVDMDVRDSTEAGLLFQTIKGLGIGLELLDLIERKLIVFASEAIVQLNQRRFEAPTYVRLFCNRYSLADINSIQSSDQHKLPQIIKSNQIIQCSEPEINRGWGYFLVERGVGSQSASSGTTCNWIELYFYKEGD